VIAGIVLAAGLSMRLGRPKQLLPLGGEPLLRRTLERVLASSLDKVVLVVGHQADEITAVVADLPVRVVINRDPARGLSASLLAGLAALAPQPNAIVVLLGDQPGVDPQVIDALVAAWRDSHAPAVVPRYTDGFSNPVLFDQRAFHELARLSGDIGARSIVLAHEAAGDLVVVPVAAPAPPDVDTESDYAALLATWEEASRR
jgi:molybdenum cofactor cytidylyltransferase